MSANLEPTAKRFLKLASRLRHLESENFPPEGIQVSPSHIALIEYTANNPNCGVQELAKALKLSTPTLSVSVRQLEKSGLITRKPDPSDGRAVQLSLTSKGEEIHQSARRFHRLKFKKLLSGLNPKERENLVNLLEKALNAVENES